MCEIILYVLAGSDEFADSKVGLAHLDLGDLTTTVFFNFIDLCNVSPLNKFLNIIVLHNNFKYINVPFPTPA